MGPQLGMGWGANFRLRDVSIRPLVPLLQDKRKPRHETLLHIVS